VTAVRARVSPAPPVLGVARRGPLWPFLTHLHRAGPAYHPPHGLARSRDRL